MLDKEERIYKKVSDVVIILPITATFALNYYTKNRRTSYLI